MMRIDFSQGNFMEIFIKHYTELTRDELYEILRARAEVFVVEQNCPYQDLDQKDIDAYHVYMKEDGEIVGYLRVLKRGVSYDDAGSIGRVITTAKGRGRGIGLALVLEGIKVAKECFGEEKLIISAQKYAVGFYEKAGFHRTEKEYLEDGIPHVQMRLGF